MSPCMNKNCPVGFWNDDFFGNCMANNFLHKCKAYQPEKKKKEKIIYDAEHDTHFVDDTQNTEDAIDDFIHKRHDEVYKDAKSDQPTQNTDHKRLLNMLDNIDSPSKQYEFLREFVIEHMKLQDIINTITKER